MKNKKFLQKRRRRENRTNYRNRLNMIKSRRCRVVVRKMLNNILVQFVNYEDNGDKVVFSYDARSLEKQGWKGHKGNISSAYLVGLACGIKAKPQIKEAILDIGLTQPIKGSTVYAALKGVIDSGIKIPCSEEILPKEDRIKGIHIEEYAKKIPKEVYQKQFSHYIKSDLKPEEISKHFQEIKTKVMKGV